MSTEVVRVYLYIAGGVAIVATVLLLDLLLSGLAKRNAGRWCRYRQRIGTQLPRVRQ